MNEDKKSSTDTYLLVLTLFRTLSLALHGIQTQDHSIAGHITCHLVCVKINYKIFTNSSSSDIVTKLIQFYQDYLVDWSIPISFKSCFVFLYEALVQNKHSVS